MLGDGFVIGKVVLKTFPGSQWTDQAVLFVNTMIIRFIKLVTDITCYVCSKSPLVINFIKGHLLLIPPTIKFNILLHFLYSVLLYSEIFNRENTPLRMTCGGSVAPIVYHHSYATLAFTLIIIKVACRKLFEV